MTEAEEKRILVELRMARSMLMLMAQMYIHMMKFADQPAADAFYENFVEVTRDYEDAKSKL
jgi:hypothetical protein